MFVAVWEKFIQGKKGWISVTAVRCWHFNLLYSSPQLSSNPDNQRKSVKISASQPLEGADWSRSSFKALSLENCPIRSIWRFLEESTQKPIFIWTDVGLTHCEDPFPIALIKNHSCLRWWIIVEWNSRLIKKPLRIRWGIWSLSIENFEKLWYISGNLEGYMQTLCCANAQERPEKILNAHLWLTLRLCASRK